MSPALLALLAPTLLAASAALGFMRPGRRPRLPLACAEPAALAALAVAIVSAVIAATKGARTSPLIGVEGVGCSVRLDAVSVAMFVLVAFIGWVVVRYAKTYLDGEDRHGLFMGWLNLTLSAVLLLVLAGNLCQLAAAWLLSGFCLQRLLLFYSGRPAARRAARKNALVSRLGDIALLMAVALLVAAYRTTDVATILRAARDSQGGAPAVGAAYLLTLAALLKSAQFPTHGWLTQVMEAPTPVSALLHAGVINGGGFLLIRLADVMLLAPAAMHALVIIGGFTAIFGGLVMLTQSAVKTSLAWSTVAQMGFMMLECGLGLFSLALLHILAHSLYKAHSFLSSGGAIDVIAANRRPGRVAVPHGGAVALAFLLAAAIYGALAAGLKVHDASPQGVALGGILIFGIAYLFAQGFAEAAPAALTWRTARYAITASLSYFVLQEAATWLTANVLPAPPPPGPFSWALIILSVTSFGLVALAQATLPLWVGHPAAARIRVHLANGWYVDALLERWLAGRGDRRARRRVAEASAGGSLAPVPTAPMDRRVLDEAVEQALRAIPPAWPLASSVAVNPFLGQAGDDLAMASARLARVGGIPLVMPRRWYANRMLTGQISDADLSAALHDAPHAHRPANVASLKRAALEPAEPARPIPTIADLARSMSGIDWPELIAERLGAWAAGFFDEGQALWTAPRHAGAYASWRAFAIADRTSRIAGFAGFSRFVAGMPSRADDAVAYAAKRLVLDGAAIGAYAHQALIAWGGWSQYARHQLWQAELDGSTDSTLFELLAIRMVWDAALLDQFGQELCSRWTAVRVELGAPFAPTPAQVVEAILQDATERAAQRKLAQALAVPSETAGPARPALQAVFCIDVRSEVFRRALETAHPDVQTLGFAGFFGLPLRYRRAGSDTAERRLPALSTPMLAARADVTALADGSLRMRARGRRAWGRFKMAAVSSFAFVESSGLLYAAKLVRHALGIPDAAAPQEAAPRFELEPDVATRTRYARDILRAMSLTDAFARLVVLVGHDAEVVNNPHASALRCGACGGYSGEANARLLADLLNDPAVRAGLSSQGISIPADTTFLGAVHDTTSDKVRIFADALASSTHEKDIRFAQACLAGAGVAARTERALRLPLAAGEHSTCRRGRDWAQTRPEWGLTGCQAFIAAPRCRTKGKDLGGRVFLHEYDWRKDRDFAILELIMTAPVIVASWISLQYYGSTVAPDTFGGGNKLLHNVTGGIGIIEGNGGLLRTGLPWQSVHDGQDYAHEPLRLTVCIEAPISAIAAVLNRHDRVRELFDNRWLHLMVLDDEGKVAWRYDGAMQWRAYEETAMRPGDRDLDAKASTHAERTRDRSAARTP